MSDAKEEKKEADKEPAKKSGGKAGFIIVAILVCVGSTLGATFGQVALAKVHPEKAKPAAGAAAAAEKAEAEPEEKEEAPAETITLEGIIIDVKAATGEMHHLKLGLAVELKKKVSEEEQKGLVFKAKDAVITYLRSLGFDDVTNQDKFEPIKKELHDRIAKAIGHGRVGNILFTEYVVQ